MKLEKWSWVAGICAAIVAVLAWLVDRNDFISFCKAAGRVIATPFLWVYHLLTHPITWPVWALILLAFFGLAIVCGVIYLFGKLADNARQPIRISEDDYKNDEIFGVRWAWNKFYGRLDEKSLTAFCPDSKCKNRLTMREDYERMRMGRGRVPISFSCRNCGFSHQFDLSWGELQRDVLEEVERRINTGEFRQRMLRAQGGADGE